MVARRRARRPAKWLRTSAAARERRDQAVRPSYPVAPPPSAPVPASRRSADEPSARAARRIDPARALRLVEDEAAEAAANPSRLRSVIRRAQAQLREDRSRIGSLKSDVPRMLRLARAVARGDYRRVPLKSLLFVVGSLLYFITPADLIPDFILGTGFLDDAVVVAYAMKAIRDDLARFEEWELANATADPEDLAPPY